MSLVSRFCHFIGILNSLNFFRVAVRTRHFQNSIKLMNSQIREYMYRICIYVWMLMFMHGHVIELSGDRNAHGPLYSSFFAFKKLYIWGAGTVAYNTNPQPVVHCSTSTPAPCLWTGKSSGGWPKSSDFCTPMGDPEEVAGSQLRTGFITCGMNQQIENLTLPHSCSNSFK